MTGILSAVGMWKQRRKSVIREAKVIYTLEQRRRKNRNGNGKKEPRQKWEIQLLTWCLQGTEGFGWDCILNILDLKVSSLETWRSCFIKRFWWVWNEIVWSCSAEHLEHVDPCASGAHPSPSPEEGGQLGPNSSVFLGGQSDNEYDNTKSCHL